MSILDSPKMKAWFESRPPAIQDLILRFPLDRLYWVQGFKNFPGSIYSYSEFAAGGVGFQVQIYSPFEPRIVFHLKEADLEPLTADEQSYWMDFLGLSFAGHPERVKKLEAGAL